MSMMPHTQEIMEDFEAIAIAADVTKEIGEVLEDVGGTITKVAVIPNAAIAGTALPNSRHWNLRNKTTNVVVATLQLANAVNPAAGVETQVPITGSAAVNNGDVLQFESIHDGTGLVDPGGEVRVTVTRTTAAQ